jgi:hypothetical protein
MPRTIAEPGLKSLYPSDQPRIDVTSSNESVSIMYAHIHVEDKERSGSPFTSRVPGRKTSLRGPMKLGVVGSRDGPRRLRILSSEHDERGREASLQSFERTLVLEMSAEEVEALVQFAIRHGLCGQALRRQVREGLRVISDLAASLGVRGRTDNPRRKSRRSRSLPKQG